MTIDQFMDTLEALSACKWGRAPNTTIRGHTILQPDLEFCPITWVAYAQGGGYYGLAAYGHAGEFLGLSEHAIAEIAAIADFCQTPQDLMEHRLFEACKLAKGGE